MSYKILEIEKEYISMYNTNNEEITYFFNIKNVDRKFIDDSFTHNYGLCRFGHYEFVFDLEFDECLDIYSDAVEVCVTKSNLLVKEAESLLSNMSEQEDEELFNKLFFV